MNNTMKKCPMCAEQIPLEATICEYCGARFEVEVKDGQVQSRFAEEAPPRAAAPEHAQPAAPADRKRSPWPVITVVVVLAGAIAGLFLLADKAPLVIAEPTTTSTRIPTRTPNHQATAQTQSTRAAATAEFAWVKEFAQPILNDVHGRQPNFEDDFSVMRGRFVRWGEERGVTFNGDVMTINTSGREWVGAGGSLRATDFVLEFDFTPRIVSPDCGASANFRAGDPGGYNFGFNLHDFWWGMGSLPAEQEYRVVADGWSEEVGLNRRTVVTIIAKGDEFAFYANGKPLLHIVNSQFGGDWVDLGVWSPNEPAEVDFDNVKFWDLNSLKP